MKEHDLSPDDWTPIARGDSDDDIEIRSTSGSFLISINQRHEVGARLLVPAGTPIPPDGWTTLQAAAGIAVYAKAVDGPAVASVIPIAR